MFLEFDDYNLKLLLQILAEDNGIDLDDEDYDFLDEDDYGEED